MAKQTTDWPSANEADGISPTVRTWINYRGAFVVAVYMLQRGVVHDFLKQFLALWLHLLAFLFDSVFW